METNSESTQTPQPTAVILSPVEIHRGKSTTALVLSIIGLALLIIPGLNVAGLVLSIIGLSMALKNRKFAAANGFKEDSNNTGAFVCGLIGVIVNGLIILCTILAIILFLALTVSATAIAGPVIGDFFEQNAPAIEDAIENVLPTVESTITGFLGIL